MSDWITVHEAAKILDVDVDLIPKMLRRGELTKRRQYPTLRRSDVVALRERRAEAEIETRARSRANP